MRFSPSAFFMYPHINSVNRGMPVFRNFSKNCAAKKNWNLPCNCSLFAHNHRSQLAMITYNYQLLSSHYNGYLKKWNHLKNIYVCTKEFCRATFWLPVSSTHLSLCTWPSLRFYQKSRPWGKKITKVQTNLVKLPYSAQKPVLRALRLILFFVLIFNLV